MPLDLTSSQKTWSICHTKTAFLSYLQSINDVRQSAVKRWDEKGKGFQGYSTRAEMALEMFQTREGSVAVLA